jgi:hypothetical protein
MKPGPYSHAPIHSLSRQAHSRVLRQPLHRKWRNLDEVLDKVREHVAKFDGFGTASNKT